MKTFEINIVGETPLNDEQIGKCLGFLNAFVEYGMNGECGITYTPLDEHSESAKESIPIEFIMKYVDSHGIYTSAMEVISAWREGKKNGNS